MGRSMRLRKKQITVINSPTKKRKLTALVNEDQLPEDRYPKRSRLKSIPYQVPQSTKISPSVKKPHQLPSKTKPVPQSNKIYSQKTSKPKRAKPDSNVAAAGQKRNAKQFKIKSGAKTPRAKKNKQDVKSDKPVKAKRKGRRGVLEPKPHVTSYDEDPTFQSNLELPPVSTLADSRLLIRAVLLDDMPLLDSLLCNQSSLCSRCVPRNHTDPSTALTYAIELENIHAITKLLEDLNLDKLAPFPSITLQKESTGHGSRLMFGHALSQVTVGRGAKEGNEAFLKDRGLYNSRIREYFNSNNIAKAMAVGMRFETFKIIPKISVNDDIVFYLTDSVIHAIRSGHCELAGKIIAEAILRGGYGFNALHEQVLLKNGDPLLPFKSVSVVKKSTGNSRITPLHCSATNPNSIYLSQLLNMNPEFYVMDADKWTLLHYAAVCKGPKPLAYLLAHSGIPTMTINKDGNMPLHLACHLGRRENVTLILNHEERMKEEDKSKGEDSNDEDIDDELRSKASKLKLASKGRTSLVIVNKEGFNVLQTAARFGHISVISAILDMPGVDVNKATSAQNEKMSPFILASAHGHLHAVKFLCENREKYKVKLEQLDRRGRTALAHAVLNGHAHIVSFLLRLGCNHLAVDTSGNTLLHYAAAYGWYFNCKLLIEAGCPVNCSNLWKLTPIAAAFMKGHIGIVQYLVKQPDVDVNSPINYQTGKTLLLESCSSTPSQELVQQIRKLVEEDGADCNLCDYNKNNALHILVQTEAIEKAKQHRNVGQQEYLVEIAKFLQSRGCDLKARNEQLFTPISLAINHGCFSFICQLLENYELHLDNYQDAQGNTVLHSLVQHATDAGVNDFYTRLSKNEENLQALREMARIRNNQSHTPLLKLLSSLSSSFSSTDYNQISRVCKLLRCVLYDLQSDVNTVCEDGTGNSALHLAALASNGEYLRELLKAKPNSEIVNASSNTPLVTAIQAGKSEAYKTLINVGANIDVDVQKPGGQSCPLLLEVAGKGIGGFSLLRVLVDKGADVSVLDNENNSVLHHICKKPEQPECPELVRELIKKGCPPGWVNKKGRTPLHLCVNSRGGRTDVMYEVEDRLIQAAPESLFARDVRGRLPLHHVFVKIGNFLDASFIDPVELVALLMKAMKDRGAGEMVDTADAFGATPLHYAAVRGAFTSATLLAGNSARVLELQDKDGNTPFGLAVLCSHQAFLFFQQKNANFTGLINKTRKKESETKVLGWTLAKTIRTMEERKKEIRKGNFISIIEQVISYEWQGILYLMLEALRDSGNSVGVALQAAIRTGRFVLAHKILLTVNSAAELEVDKKDGSVIHTLAKYCGEGREGQLPILSMILDKGVDIFAKDEFQSTAIIYAARSRNSSLCRELAKQMQLQRSGTLCEIVGKDVFGRNHLSAIFENSLSTSFPYQLKNWLEEFVRLGDWDMRCHFPLELSDISGVRYFALSKLDVDACNENNCFSPLIASVISGNYSAVKWLLTRYKCPADPNFPDGRGRTALMHAVRLNDIKMIKLLFNPDCYSPQHDSAPWRDLILSSTSKQIDLLARDKNEKTLFHHLISPSITAPFYYTNSDKIFKFIYSANSEVVQNAIQSDKTLFLNVKNLDRFHILEAMEILTGVPNPSKLDYPEFPLMKETPSMRPPSHVQKDALHMVQKLTNACAVENEPPPDPLLGHEAQEFRVVLSRDKTYDCVMTMVDLNYGAYGLYNFYKMQLLEQLKGNRLIILFTRWGRVGEDGQYQKTPFATLPEGIKEFEKIFRAKSGNVWENSLTFTHTPGKYRLVDNHQRRALPPHVPVDFTTLEQIIQEKPTHLPKSLFKLIQTLSFVHKTQGRLSDNMRHSGNMVELPFGFVTAEAFEKAEEILKGYCLVTGTRENVCTTCQQTLQCWYKQWEITFVVPPPLGSTMPLYHPFSVPLCSASVKATLLCLTISQR